MAKMKSISHPNPLRRALELRMLAPDAWFSDGVAYPKTAWLSTDLLPKLVRWAAQNKGSQFGGTLSLLPLEKYSVLYQRLKDKYRAVVKVERCAPATNRCRPLRSGGITSDGYSRRCGRR